MPEQPEGEYRPENPDNSHDSEEKKKDGQPAENPNAGLSKEDVTKELEENGIEIDLG